MMPWPHKREYGKEAKRPTDYPNFKCDECGEVGYWKIPKPEGRG
jgi:hypothetical protein